MLSFLRALRFRSAAGLGLALWLFFLPLHALADGERAAADDEGARMHFLSANEYFKRGNYAEAAREFEASYALSGRTALLYNVYTSYERSGDLSRAADALGRFLAESGELPERSMLEARHENLLRRVEEQREAEAAREAELAAARESARAAESGPATEVSKKKFPAPAIVAFSLAGAGLATTAVAGGLALAEDSRVAERCGRDAGRTCSDDELAGLDRKKLVADVGLGVAGVSAVAGLALWLILRDRPRDESAAQVRVLPVLSPAQAGGSFEVRF